MGFMDKIKDFAGKNPDKVDKFTEKAGDMFDEKTGGKYAEQTDKAQNKAGDFLTGGESGGEPDQPQAGEQPGDQQPPAGEQPGEQHPPA